MCFFHIVKLYTAKIIPANSHALGVSLTPAGWKLRSHTSSHVRANFSRLIENVSCCRLAWHNFQKYVNSDPCKEQKPCVKWINDNTFLTISDFSREKHWERARVYTVLRLRKSSDFFGRLRTSSGIFGNDRVWFKIPGTARIKISRLHLRKSWQVYSIAVCLFVFYQTNSTS